MQSPGKKGRDSDRESKTCNSSLYLTSCNNHAIRKNWSSTVFSSRVFRQNTEKKEFRKESTLTRFIPHTCVCLCLWICFGYACFMCKFDNHYMSRFELERRNVLVLELWENGKSGQKERMKQYVCSKGVFFPFISWFTLFLFFDAMIFLTKMVSVMCSFSLLVSWWLFPLDNRYAFLFHSSFWPILNSVLSLLRKRRSRAAFSFFLVVYPVLFLLRVCLLVGLVFLSFFLSGYLLKWLNYAIFMYVLVVYLLFHGRMVVYSVLLVCVVSVLWHVANGFTHSREENQ